MADHTNEDGPKNEHREAMVLQFPSKPVDAAANPFEFWAMEPWKMVAELSRAWMVLAYLPWLLVLPRTDVASTTGVVIPIR